MGRQQDMVRFFTYSQFHGKAEPTGSDFIRVMQLIKYWPGAGLYKYGENPDVLIFNKVFCTDDYKFPAHFENITILDICDPLWLEGAAVVETCQAVNAVTTSTEELADFVRQFTKNVKVIPDRFDVEILPSPKKHQGDAKSVVWFGYSHNSELLRPALNKLKEMNLKLILISNDDPIPSRWGLLPDLREYLQNNYQFIRYNEETIYQDLQKADFALLPAGFRPVDRFKSENKTVKAQLAGLPVAYDFDTMLKFMDGKVRQEFVDTNYEIVKDMYDVRRSVADYKELIESL